MLSYKVNKYITLKLEHEKTEIYINNRRFNQCRHLLFSIPFQNVDDYDEIDSIDEAIEIYSKNAHRLPHRSYPSEIITPKQEFWGHCSNIQAWVEHEYDTRLLHSNLSFPFLKELYNVGDSMAKKVFKEEIATRLESASTNVIEYLWNQKYIDFLTMEEIESVVESPRFIENFIKNTKKIRSFDLFDKISPHFTKIFAEMIYKLLKKGTLKNVINQIISNSSLGIVINFFRRNWNWN